MQTSTTHVGKWIGIREVGLLLAALLAAVAMLVVFADSASAQAYSY